MQATIYTIEPFDAEIGTTIRFNWNGNQVFGNRCIIVDHETNTEVYNCCIDSFKLEHTIDLSQMTAGQELVNGKRYIAFITVFDQDGVESDLQSVGQIFLCLKTPEYGFDNVVENQVLAASGYEFQLAYSQENGELLDSWQISVYDTANKLLSTSGIKYTTEKLSHTFSGFTNKNRYRVRAVGQTVNGMMLDTGFVPFSVSYDMTAVFSMLDLTNLPKSGAVLVHSNIISADGRSEKEPVSYINGTYVDLTENSVTYDEGFLLAGDFSLVLYAYRMKPNIPFFEFRSANDPALKGTITYRVGYIGTTDWSGQLELRITNGVTDYVVYSDLIPAVEEDTLLGFCLTRQGGYYDIQIADLGTVTASESEEVA